MESNRNVYRYFIKLSFDGSTYHGWQIQKNSSQTIQQKINEGLSQLLNEPISVLGCCRTDAGVHALELYAHFDSLKDNLHKREPADWLYKFNKIIPPTISIHAIHAVKPTAHARFDALERVYHYQLHQTKNPFLVNRSWHYHGKLDIDSMNQAAAIVTKHTDFSAFSKLNTQTKTNICVIQSAQWCSTHEGNLLFAIRADRFLRSMVRMIVGTMIQVGKHKLTLQEFEDIIKSNDCRNAEALAPACGLYLAKVNYPETIWIT
jgi:tRNA pseudouridine38-40 synthase